ncbi:MAG: sulfotransferase [Rhodocyclaceae bacterium]|nr:sulfotransferase [Rhodocyclaceae bacterium]
MVQCLYICGAGHSGSTLLDMLLGSHSRIASLGEVINLPMDLATNSTCTCGQKVCDCELWSAVVREFEQRQGLDLDKDPYALNLGPIYAVAGDPRVTGGLYRTRRRLGAALHYLELRAGLFGALRPLLPTLYKGLENNLLLYDIVGRLLDADFVVDSSKIYTKAVGLSKLAPERVKIILLIRDGRAVYYSMRKRNYARKFSLDSWYTHFRRALPLIERHVPAGNVLTVKYEALATDPERELHRICDFAGTAFEPAMLDIRSRPHHNVNGNDMRFSSAFDIRIDNTWETKLNAEERAYFEVRAGWLNKELGYR